mmetsp:Transcript_6137/g.9591  ORF Transcript_6137/g.9591 Transcript_6137/m.9591 type:complete len:120 (+) Transcript_6137:39-398(+)
MNLGSKWLVVMASVLLVLALSMGSVFGKKASASHILVKTEKEANDLKAKVAAGESFASLAEKHSSCPSGRKGGSLGQFGPGQMVPEFDTVVFSEAVGEVHGPVKTQFGYHLILINERED